MRQSATRLSTAHLRLFLAILLHNEALFQEYWGKLTVEHFTTDSNRLLFRALINLYEENQSIPAQPELWTEIASYFEDDPELIPVEDRAELEDFFEYAYDPELFATSPATGQKMHRFGLKVGRMLMLQHERQALEQNIRQTSLDDLPFLLQQHQVKLDLVGLLQEKTGPTLTMKPDWSRTNPMLIRSTGLGFLDNYLGGGTVAGEAYGFMAPYGTCKTTVAVMLWATAAQQCYEDTLAEDWDQRKGLSVLVTYEAPLAPEILHRLVMYSSRVSRYSLERMGLDGIDALNNNENDPLSYEQRLFTTEIRDGVFKPERVRVAEIEHWVNAHTLCLDFSGADPLHPTAGNGGVAEIVQRIKQELQQRGPEYYIKNVIIDYLGLMIDNDSKLKNTKNPMETHRSYQQAGELCVKQICKPFNCHAWLMHQLSGEANSQQSVTAKLHHTDAKGSKSFAENLSFAFVVGNLNLEGLGQIMCTKHRRYRRLPPTIIKVDGEFNLVLSPDNYHIDSRGNIVDKATANLVGAAVPNIAVNVNQTGMFDEDSDEELEFHE